jgi:hypothetical protein
MAIARCDKHTSDGTKHAYKAFALPLGYPETAAICGREGCEAPARLWLREPERADYQRGERGRGKAGAGAYFIYSWSRLVTAIRF